jgi:dCMP deaminase
MLDWKNYFIQLAEVVKLKSKDESTQIGVVIVGPDNEVVSTGYNSFPRGIQDNLWERQMRPEKYYWMAHAERNAIYNAARIGVSTKGCTMYCTCGVPCSDCSIAIIQAGIKTIWVKQYDTTNNPDKSNNPDKWMESAKRSLQMLKEAKVKVKYY